ncbi:MAG: proteasome accessory factor C [Saprospiraceae bacterium]|jgi:proteasome accessory factor C
MDTQQKLYKVLQLIRLLNTPPAKDVPQLARWLDSSKTRIYEYIKLLESVGYEIDTDDRHRKALKLSVTKYGNGALESDELAFIHEMLQQDSSKKPIAQQLLHKLDVNLSLIPIADALPQLHASRIIQLIRTGINLQKQIILSRYRSLTSNTMEDRHVEPMELTADSRYLIAWDITKKGQRQFKLERIEDIDILEEAVNKKRIASPMDIFGMTSDDEMGHHWHSVTLNLSAVAHHLIIEEFPLSHQYIRKVSHQIIFDGMVRHWKGIGRFCLGLPGEVEVLELEAFREYLNKKTEKL